MATSFFSFLEVNHLNEMPTPTTSTYSEIGITTYMTAAEQMDTITAIMLEEKASHVEVSLPNGDSFYFSNKMTLGDAIVASSIFLLLAFLVIKWLLDKVWGRG